MKHIKKINSIFLTASIICLLVVFTANAENVLNKDFNSFKLELENDASSMLFIVNGKKEKPKVIDLFELKNPNRIVLDVANISANSNANYALNKSSKIRKVRIGKHSEKVRFVLDLEDGEIPKFNVVSSTGNNLIVKLNKNSIDQVKNDIAEQKPAPKQNNVAKALPVTKPLNTQNTNSNIEKKDIVKDIPPHKEASNKVKTKVAKKKESTDKTLSGDQGLENIKFYFKKDKKTPLVRFMFVNKPKYTIKRKDEKKYLLTIENARIRWPHLELPQFPPRDFRGFTMIMPGIKNGNLEIVIGVERGSKVVSFTKDSEVWLKVENYS